MAKTILLIEADEGFAAQLTEGLEKRGASVKHTADGKEGLHIAGDGDVDAIVLCVELPKMSGYAVCNKLKKSDDLKDIPLVITSSEATPKTFEQHKKLKTRAEDYVIKPCDPSEIIEKLNALVGLESPEDEESTVNEGMDEDLELLEDAFDALEMDEDDGTQIVDTADLEDVSLEPLEVSESQVEEVASADIALDALGDDLSADVEVLDDASLIEEDDEADLGLESLDDALDDAEEPSGAPEVAEPAIESLGDALEAADASAVEDERPAHKRPGEAAVAHRLAAIEEENAKLRKERTDLEAKLAEVEDELRAKSNELEAFRAGGGGGGSARDVLRLKGEITQRDKEILSLKETLNEKEKAALDWQERENELELRAAELEEAAVGHEAQLKTLTEKIEAQSERIERLQGELEAAQDGARRVGELEAEIEAMGEERATLERQVAELGERLAEANGKASGLEQEAEATRAELEASIGELESVRAEIDGLRADAERASGLEEELAEARGRLESLESENAKNEERALKAYQRLKADEKLRDKTRKALEVAMQLLDESPGEVASDEDAEDDLDLQALEIESA